MKSNNRRRHNVIAVDSRWSWVVSVATAWIFFWVVAVLRSSGVFFVAMVSTFQITRGEASWPFSLINTVMQIMGLFTGIIIKKFKLRYLSLIGTLICGISIFMCFVFFNVTSITVFIALSGLGLGLINPVNNIMVNNFFEKNRSTASGICLAGATVSSFVFPPLFMLILEEYGLRGMFAIASGFVFHSVAGALFMREPPWFRKRINRVETKRQESKPFLDRRSSSCVSNARFPAGGTKYALSMARKRTISNASSLTLELDIPVVDPAGIPEVDEDAISIIDENSEEILEEKHPSQEEIVLFQRNNPQPLVYQSTTIPIERPLSQTIAINIKKQLWWTKYMNFLKKPMFYVLTVFCIGTSYLHLVFMMTCVDYGIEKGFVQKQATLLLSTYSVGDLAGRLLSGMISDKKILDRKHVLALNAATIGLVCLVVPLCDTFPLMVLASLLLGWSFGSSVILFSVMLAIICGLENLGISLGALTFLTGIVTLFRPSLISYYRDTLGSYDGLYRLMGILFFFLCVILLVESFWKRICSSSKRPPVIVDPNSSEPKTGRAQKV